MSDVILSSEQTLARLHWQYATKKFDPNKKISESAWGQKPVVDASHLVIFPIKKDIDNEYVDHYINRMAEVQKVSIEKLEGFANMVKSFLQKPPFPLDVNEWAAKQTYIALGFFMNCVAMMSIDTLPMEGFVPAQCDEILNLSSQGYASVVLCAARYRVEDNHHTQPPKVRFPEEQVIEYID